MDKATSNIFKLLTLILLLILGLFYYLHSINTTIIDIKTDTGRIYKNIDK